MSGYTFSSTTPVSQNWSSSFEKLFLEISEIIKSEHMNYDTVIFHSLSLSAFILILIWEASFRWQPFFFFWEEYEFI